jgi:hypothetical protein
MAKAKKTKLLSFTLPNKVGQLAAAGDLIAAEKLDITAFCAKDAGNTAEFLLLTDKNAKAKKALAPLGVEIKEEDAVIVRLANKPGRLQKVAKKLAEAQINIHASWATALSGKTAACIMMTSDDAKAVASINAKKGA